MTVVEGNSIALPIQTEKHTLTLPNQHHAHLEQMARADNQIQIRLTSSNENSHDQLGPIIDITSRVIIIYYYNNSTHHQVLQIN